MRTDYHNPTGMFAPQDRADSLSADPGLLFGCGSELTLIWLGEGLYGYAWAYRITPLPQAGGVAGGEPPCSPGRARRRQMGRQPIRPEC